VPLGRLLASLRKERYGMDGLLDSTPRVAIVGAGMSGLCMAAKLRRAGIDTFTIYEKASEVGGTWRENTYPGLTCDVPSRFYSYSFAPNPGWTRHFAPGREIQRYFSRAVDELGLREHIRFDAEVVRARWEEGRWRLWTRDGREDVADVLVSATGVLHHPREPEIEGLDTFAGARFHSARWDHSVPLEGRRIAVIGTGSTGVQIVCALADVAGRLLVFQRTAQWILPVANLPYSGLTRRAFERFPALNRLSYHVYQAALEILLGRAATRPGWQRRLISAICRLNLRFGVRDPDLRRRLTPDYEPMCKRLVMSGEFYPAMQRPNVGLVTTPIDHVEPRGIVTGDGRLHEIDVLVFATGFDAHAYMRPMELVGEGGRTLEEAWADGPVAYRTVALPGFPNFFMMLGPHSPIGNQSLVAVAETQSDYALRWVEEMRAGRVAAAAPTPEATARFNQEMRSAMPSTVWVTGCKSWYLDADGLPEAWPWTPGRHRAMLREPELADFALRHTNSPA
jgi:cation diffusion facilitator CzcD-associated flavoprotein CzcO